MTEKKKGLMGTRLTGDGALVLTILGILFLGPPLGLLVGCGLVLGHEVYLWRHKRLHESPFH